jgi:hypothetical protein
MLTEEHNRLIPNAEHALPKRPRLLKERAEAIETKSRTELDEPSLANPKRESEEPSLQNDRHENEDPM